MNYITRDDVLDLHMCAIERYGGRLGIRSQDRLLAAVTAPRQVMFGTELYPDLASKTAALGFMLLKNRPFNAGNEATALLAMLRMLTINTYRLNPDFSRRLAPQLRGVLHSRLERDDLTNWLSDELVEMERVS